jgi:hypothetical protein
LVESVAGFFSAKGFPGRQNGRTIPSTLQLPFRGDFAMSFKMDRVHVWSGEVEDKAGGIASKLVFLAQAGANLEYIFTKRLPQKPGKGVLYVAPISGPTQVAAAKSAGLTESDDPVVHRVEGDNQAGLAHRVTQKWAEAGISFHGLTLAVVADKFIGYAAFDSVNDANQAAKILAEQGTLHTEPGAN